MPWDDVVEIGLGLPDVRLDPAYGMRALRVRRSLMCRLGEDGETLAGRCDLEERPHLIAAHEGVLVVTARHESSPMALVALPRASREPVEDAWAERAPEQLVSAWRAERAAGG